MFQILILYFIWLGALVASPITNPLRSDEDIGHAIPEYFDSKKSKPFHTFTPNTSVAAQEVLYTIEQGASVEFSLRWSTSLGSPIFSSPVIFPSTTTGQKQIFVNTFYQYAELVDSDGYKPWGWPLSFEDSSFQGSPMVYDVDGDGNVDMGLVDKNGNMLWVRIGDSGEYLEDYHVQVPKLRVKRDWAEGLDPSFVDSYVKLSMFDRESSSGEDQRKKARLDDLQAVPETATSAARRRLSEEDEGAVPDFGEEGEVDDFIRSEAERMAARSSEMYGVDGAEEGGPGDQKASLEDVLREQEPSQGEEAEEMVDGTYEYAYRAAPHRARGGHGTGYGAGAYYAGGGDFNGSDYVMVDAHVLASPVLADINGDGHMEVLVSVSYYFDKAEYAGRELGFDPDNFVAGGVACWDLDEQRWTWLVHLDLTTALSKFQAMIYAPPTVADLDGDGRTEVIVGTAMGLLYVMDGESGFVRRFFPMQFHSIQAQVVVAALRSGGQGGLQMIVLDMGGTVAVVDLDGDILWDTHVSGTLPFPATVGDVDGDGLLDVVVVAATEGKGSHIYALRGDTGAVLPGFPISLPGNSAVSSPVLLVDLLSPQLRDAGQGKSSSSSNASAAAMLTPRRSAAPRRSPLLAGTVDDPFPIESLLSVENMRASAASDSLAPPLKGLHLVVTSYEGAVYLIFGQPTLKMVSTGATAAALQPSEPEPEGKSEALIPRFHAQRLDVGEHVYSAPLLDDVTGDGYLDLLVGTLNGQLLLFESAVPFHPSNAWTSFPNHRLNSVTHGALGIAIPQEEKDKLRQLDVKGKDTLSIAFDIWDLHPNQDSEYTVSVTRGTNRLQPLWKQSFDRPGRHVADIPVTPPELALLVFSMKSRHGEYFEDTVHVALSTKFYVWLKYLLAAPIVLLTFTLLSRFRKQAV